MVFSSGQFWCMVYLGSRSLHVGSLRGNRIGLDPYQSNLMMR